MIIYMFNILCFTNRTLCHEDFLCRITQIAQANPYAIVLREKDLPENEYKILAKEVIQICSRYNTLCILHNFAGIAAELNHTALHVPLHILRSLSIEERSFFKILGASCHSTEDAIEAEKLGCTYITAGHIFATDCKKGLPERGTDFLSQICHSISIPVYAIGGINQTNIDRIYQAGAKGACLMSSFMTCENPQTYMEALTPEGFS